MSAEPEGESGVVAPDSPCIGVCTIGADDYCIGCYRSLDEIAAWSRMTAAEQQTVIEELPGRASALASACSGK